MEIFLICSFQHIRLATRRHVVKEELAAVQLRYCSALEKALEHKQTRGVPGKRLPKRGTALVVNNKMLQTKGSSLGAFADWVGRIRHVTSETWAGTNHVCVVTEAPTQLWRYNCKLRRLTTDAVLQTAVEAEKLEVLAFWYRPEGYLFVTTDQSVWIKPHENPHPIKTSALLSASRLPNITRESRELSMKKWVSRVRFLSVSSSVLLWGKTVQTSVHKSHSECLLVLEIKSGAVIAFQTPEIDAITASDIVDVWDRTVYVFSAAGNKILKFERDGAGSALWKITGICNINLSVHGRVRTFTACDHGLVFSMNYLPSVKIAYSLVDRHTLKMLFHLPGKLESGPSNQSNQGLQVPTKLGLVLLLFFPVHGYLDVVLARPGKLHWVVKNKAVKIQTSDQSLTLVCMNRSQATKAVTRAEAASHKSIVYTIFTLQENGLSHRFLKVRLPV